MIEIDLDRNFDDRSEPSLKIAGGFAALKEYMKLLDEFVPHVQDQLLLRMKAKLQAEYSSRGEIDTRHISANVRLK